MDVTDLEQRLSPNSEGTFRCNGRVAQYEGNYDHDESSLEPGAYHTNETLATVGNCIGFQNGRRT
jgi:hypothetical protein